MKSSYHPPLTVTRRALLKGGSDVEFRRLIYRLLLVEERLRRARDFLGKRAGLTGPQYTMLITIAYLQGATGIPQQNLNALNGIIQNVHTQGTNLSNGATGNASGNVGFAGGPQTFQAGGERFGREGQDAKWTPPYRGAPPQQQASTPMPAPMGLGGPPQQQGRPMPAPGQQDDGQQGGFGGLLSQLNDPVKSPLYSPLTQIGLGLLSHPTQPAGVGLAAGVKSGQDANEFRYKMQQRQQDQALSSSLQGANAPAWFKALPPEVQGVFSQLPPDQLASSIAGYVSKRSDLDQAAKLQTQQLGITNKFALEQQRAQFQQIMDMAKGAQQAGQQQVNQSPNPQPPQRLKWIPQ